MKSHNLAIGDKYGKVKLYDRVDYSQSPHASLHKAVITEIHNKAALSYDIVVETLDNFSEKQKIDYVDFMKIDTEGNEMAVLNGASKLLDNGKIGCVQFEFNEMNVISRVFFRDFRKKLDKYNLYRLLPNGLLPLDDYPFTSPLLTELFAYQNIVALPKKWAWS